MKNSENDLTIDKKNGDDMPNNTANCTLCPFNPQSNVVNLHSKNLSYIWKAKNHGPLMLEDNNSDILLVFEAPGIDEWSNHRPLSSNRPGSAAVAFGRALEATKKKRIDYDITEAVACCPGTSTGKTNKKIPSEVILASSFCKQYLMLDILRKNYVRIVCFGSIAYSSVLSVYHDIKWYHAHYNFRYLSNIVHLTHPSCSKTLIQDIATYL